METHVIYDMNSLYDAYMASMKGSSWKSEPQKFELNFLSEITKLHQELKTKTYETSPGTEFVLNERGKTRYIHGNRMRDRVVRHSFCDNILSPMLNPYLIHNNGASQKGKGLSFSRRLFEKDLHDYFLEYGTNDGYVGFVDLSKFYDNIQHDKIKELINPIIDEYSQWLLANILSVFRIDVSYMTDDEYEDCIGKLFDSIVYNNTISEELKTGTRFMDKSVDIGDQVSQNIGIFFPMRIDNYAKIVRGCKRYGRYMDDIYIIGRTKAEVESVINGIEHEADALGLFVNNRKTRVVKLSDSYKYLQVKYTLSKSGKVIKRINPQIVTRERRKIKAYKHLLDNKEISYEDVEQSVKSWMGSFYKLMSKQQIRNIRNLYKELFGRDLHWKKQRLNLKPER